MYLVITEDNIIECEDFEEVETTLFDACVKWVYAPNYIGEETPEEIFEEGMKNKDFGDVAAVYKYDVYFSIHKNKIPCELWSADKNIPFTITRII